MINKNCTVFNNKNIEYKLYSYSYYLLNDKNHNQINFLSSAFQQINFCFNDQYPQTIYQWNNKNIYFNYHHDHIQSRELGIYKFLIEFGNNKKIDPKFKLFKIKNKYYVLDKDKNFYIPQIMELRFIDNKRFFTHNNMQDGRVFPRGVVLTKHSSSHNRIQINSKRYNKNKLWEKWYIRGENE